MKIRLSLMILYLICLSALGAKRIDPYKVLGVEKNASQREIQKAFHKLSLQYHPDKNKNKGAQEKFSDINNAYEILSDEEKRKNYDLYGDEKGNPGFDAGNPGGHGGYSYAGNPGGHGGYSYFTNGGPGETHFSFRPGGWQSTGGQGASQGSSYRFSGSGDRSPFNFGFDDIFASIFGGGMFGGGQSGGFGSARSQSGSKGPSKSIRSINSLVFKKEVANKGMTWLLLFETPTLMNNRVESVVEEVGRWLEGVVKVGRVNCESEPSFCKDLGTYPRKVPRLFVYAYKYGDSGSLVEYKGDLFANDLETFCHENLPQFSKRIDLKHLEFSFGDGDSLPGVMLLTSKKDTPAIWRALSGLYHKRFNFYDLQVHDVSDPAIKKLGINALPAIVGWLSNGEKHTLKAGISVKDVNSAINELSALFDGFERKNKKSDSSRARKAQTESVNEQIPLLKGANFDDLCGQSSPLCIIGAFRSSRARKELESILSVVSKKSFSRKQSLSNGNRDSISYALLDASKQPAFLNAFDKSGYKSSDKVLVAYKHRKGKFAIYAKELGTEQVEQFISSVLSGDVTFTKTRQPPKLT
ncbi:dnaJ protein ERDJ3A [Rhodamnia argentea]|uniref:DnaJ protein ERDJ3A n=1 Tax=Rhodamnia argentea TaxID=178133 RepID=A0A8B8PSG2_9MYRT|nr:dnaJ protein ERDJ3A [Rhodamnia argentea]